jgi:hypothetical protein
MPRLSISQHNVFAIEIRTALPAAYTLEFGIPMCAWIEPFSTMVLPEFSSVVSALIRKKRALHVSVEGLVPQTFVNIFKSSKLGYTCVSEHRIQLDACCSSIFASAFPSAICPASLRIAMESAPSRAFAWVRVH